MIADSLVELFRNWCKNAGGVLREGKNYVGEKVLACLRPAKDSFINLQGTEQGIIVGKAFIALRFATPKDFEVVFTDGDGWVRTTGYARYGIQINDPEVVTLVPEEKRVYIGDELKAPRWAKIASE